MFKHFLRTTPAADPGDNALVAVITGFWNDDGDANHEAGEFACGGMIFKSFPIVS